MTIRLNPAVNGLVTFVFIMLFQTGFILWGTTLQTVLFSFWVITLNCCYLSFIMFRTTCKIRKRNRESQAFRNKIEELRDAGRYPEMLAALHEWKSWIDDNFPGK